MIMRWFAPFLVATSMAASGAAAQTDLQHLRDLNDFCSRPQWLSGASDAILRFAPMERVPESERPPGSFGYTYLTLDQRYPPSPDAVEPRQPVVSLSRFATVWLVMDLPKPDATIQRPSHVWLMVSVPRDEHSFYAQFDEHAAFIKDRGGSTNNALWSGYERAKVSREVNGDVDVLTFLRRGISPGDRLAVGDFWGMSLGASYDNTIDPTRDRFVDGTVENAYEHFFSYVRMTPDRRNRYPVEKRIRRAGKAFGFLLDDTHRCIAATSIDIVE